MFIFILFEYIFNLCRENNLPIKSWAQCVHYSEVQLLQKAIVWQYGVELTRLSNVCSSRKKIEGPAPTHISLLPTAVMHLTS